MRCPNSCLWLLILVSKEVSCGSACKGNPNKR